jgi:hypothetical protein
MNQFDDVISIGYICNVSMLLGTTSDNKYVFDRTATPMWAVTSLVENNFSDFMLKNNLEKQILFNNDTTEYAVDTNYYIRMRMTLPLSDERYINFFTNINLAKNRFLDKLNSQSDSILFIRAREPMVYSDDGERIISDKYIAKYSKDELEYLKDFSQLLMNKYPNLKFNILFLSENTKNVDKIHKIVTVPEPPYSWKDPRIGRKMRQHIETYRGYIDESLYMLNNNSNE